MGFECRQQGHGGERDTLEDKLLWQLRTCGHFLHHNTGGKAGQHRILTILAERGDTTQKELQEILDVRSGSISEILNKVEADGFIERIQSKTDKRQMNLKLTESGREAASQMGQQSRDLVSELFAGLSEEEKEQLAGLLEKVLGDWGNRRGCGRGRGRFDQR